MAFENLSEQEQEVIRQALFAVLHGPYIDDFEFGTRLGLDRVQVAEVLAAWPRLEDSDEHGDVSLAINNCLNEILYGVYVSPKDWAKWFTVSKEDVQRVYQRWAQLKGCGSTGIRE